MKMNDIQTFNVYFNASNDVLKFIFVLSKGSVFTCGKWFLFFVAGFFITSPFKETSRYPPQFKTFRVFLAPFDET